MSVELTAYCHLDESEDSGAVTAQEIDNGFLGVVDDT
jgi:hypothetical protein